MSKRINLDNLKTFLRQLKTNIINPIINDVSTLTTKVRNAENNIQTANSNISNIQQALNDKADKNHVHTIADVTNLQTTLDKKAPINYLSQFEGGAISSNFRKKLVGTTDMYGFAKSFRKNDSTDACFPQYASGIAWGQGDTHGMICTDYVTPTVYVGGGNGNKLNWYKQIAFKEDLTNLQNSLSNAINNKFALQVNVKHYINNSELLTYVDTDNTQMQFKKSGLYKITVTKANNQTSGISFCDTSLDFETKGNVLVGYNVGLYEPVSSSLVMYIDKTKTYEFFGFALSDYHGATEYVKYRGTDFKTNLQGSNILIELIKEC